MIVAFAVLILFLLLAMYYNVVPNRTRQRIQKLEEDNKVLMDKNLCLEELCKESSRTKRCFDNFKAEVELFDKVWKGSNEKQEDMDPSKLSEYFAHWVKDFKTFNELYKLNRLECRKVILCVRDWTHCLWQKIISYINS